MVRLIPRDLDDLLTVWGISPNRLSQHGGLMLAALEPFRTKLERERESLLLAGAGGTDKGDGRPHPHWVATQRKQGLPIGGWENRRTLCVTEYGCRACEQHGPDGPWAPASQTLLAELDRVYGSLDGCEEAGWRWFAKPNHRQNSHKHQWWPPLSLCQRHGVTQLPLGTTAARGLLPE